MYYRVSLAQSKMYIRSTTCAAREAFKINTSEAFKQPFHITSFKLPKRSIRSFSWTAREALKSMQAKLYIFT